MIKPIKERAVAFLDATLKEVTETPIPPQPVNESDPIDGELSARDSEADLQATQAIMQSRNENTEKLYKHTVLNVAQLKGTVLVQAHFQFCGTPKFVWLECCCDRLLCVYIFSVN